MTIDHRTMLGTGGLLGKTAMWDVIGWNRAAAVLLTDYATLPPEGRNILRLMFGNDHVRVRNADFDSIARFVVGAFRADVARGCQHQCGSSEAGRRAGG